MMACLRAMATACVRVSASNLERICRTWLLTVSWLMKSLRGDVGVRHAVGQELQDLALARGEHVLAFLRQERGHERRVDVAVAAGHLLDGAHQRLVRSLLQDVALGAGFEAAREEAALAVGGEHQHGRLGHLRGDLAGGLEAVDAGHAHVHDDDVGAPPAGERDCGAAVGGLTDDADVVRAGQRQAQPLTYHLVVIDNQTGNRLGHMCSTRRKTSFRRIRYRQNPLRPLALLVRLASGFRRFPGISCRSESAAAPRA